MFPPEIEFAEVVVVKNVPADIRRSDVDHRRRRTFPFEAPEVRHSFARPRTSGPYHGPMLDESAQHDRLSGLQKRLWQRMWIDARNFGNLPVDFHFVMRIYRQLVEGNRKPNRRSR
jgi:hypothetical protein